MCSAVWYLGLRRLYNGSRGREWNSAGIQDACQSTARRDQVHTVSITIRVWTRISLSSFAPYSCYKPVLYAGEKQGLPYDRIL